MTAHRSCAAPAGAPAAGIHSSLMAMPVTAMTSQEALDAILSDTLPRQGRWSDEDYLWLTDRSRRLIEFTDGCIEALPLPTSTHQAILAFLYQRGGGQAEPDHARQPWSAPMCFPLEHISQEVSHRIGATPASCPRPAGPPARSATCRRGRR